MADTSIKHAMFAPPVAPILPYTGTFGRKQLMHLLRRTLFGVSNADLKAFEGKTLDQVVTSLLNVTDFNPAPPLHVYTIGNRVDKIPAVAGTEEVGIEFGKTWVNATTNGVGANDGQRRASFKAWWGGLMVHQERNLREKMTLFYANHFSMEADAVNSAVYSYKSNQLTRKYCLGNFKDLMRDITTDGGMLVYLNGNRNTKAAPDENYARELQELFTLGKGADSKYTEDDVKEAAKILTGWTTDRGKPNNPPAFKPALHDTTNKKFSAFYGNVTIKGDATANGGKNEINALLDMIFALDEVAKFMVRRLYTFFVHYDITSDIETKVITPLADLFRTSNYEIKPVLKALFTSDDFYKANNIGAMIKSPLDHAVGFFRQFEVEIPKDATLFEAQYAAWRNIIGKAADHGQNLQDPPNVAGWAAYYQAPFFYDSWLDAASYPKRESFQKSYSSLIGGAGSGDEYSIATPAARNIRFKTDYNTWLKGFSNPQNAATLINEIAELFYGAAISQTVKDKLKANKLWYKIGNQTITTDKEWSDAVTAYLANPSTADLMAKSVPVRVQNLVSYMMRAAEYHLH